MLAGRTRVRRSKPLCPFLFLDKKASASCFSMKYEEHSIKAPAPPSGFQHKCGPTCTALGGETETGGAHIQLLLGHWLRLWLGSVQQLTAGGRVRLSASRIRTHSLATAQRHVNSMLLPHMLQVKAVRTRRGSRSHGRTWHWVSWPPSSMPALRSLVLRALVWKFLFVSNFCSGVKCVTCFRCDIILSHCCFLSGHLPTQSQHSPCSWLTRNNANHSQQCND